jgi:hypothetical protein
MIELVTKFMRLKVENNVVWTFDLMENAAIRRSKFDLLKKQLFIS